MCVCVCAFVTLFCAERETERKTMFLIDFASTNKPNTHSCLLGATLKAGEVGEMGHSTLGQGLGTWYPIGII